VFEAMKARHVKIEQHGNRLWVSREDADAWLAEREVRSQGMSISEMARRSGVCTNSIRKALEKRGLMEHTVEVAGQRVLPMAAAEKFIADYGGGKRYQKSRGEERWKSPPDRTDPPAAQNRDEATFDETTTRPLPPSEPAAQVHVVADIGALFDRLTSQRRTRLLEREVIDGSIREIDEALAAVRTVAKVAGFELPEAASA
jgi:hypothetical protein